MTPQKRTSTGPVTIVVDGEELNFLSLETAAKHFGISPSTVYSRVKIRGWSVVQALLTNPKKMIRSLKVQDGGRIVEFPSIKAAAAEYGLDYHSVRQRMNKLGWTPEQALEIEVPPIHQAGCIGYVYKITHRQTGKIYIGQTKTLVKERWKQHIKFATETQSLKSGSLHQAMKSHGENQFICETLDSATTIGQLNQLEREYIKQFDSLDPAFGFNQARGGSGLTGGQKTTVNGKRYRSLSEAARAHGVEPKIAHQRLKENGWTLSEALGLDPAPVQVRKEITVVDQGRKVHFDTNRSAAKMYGVDYRTLSSRLLLGWSIEESLGLKPHKRKASERRVIVVSDNNVKRRFPSVAVAAREYGLNRSKVQARLDRGWSPEESLEIVYRKPKTRSE